MKNGENNGVLAGVPFLSPLRAPRALGWGRNKCVTNEPQRTSAGRLRRGLILRLLRYKITVYACIYVCHLCRLSGHVDYVFIPKKKVFGSLLNGITLSSVEQNGFANRGQAVTGPYSDSSD